jgi:hypothetical protein
MFWRVSPDYSLRGYRVAPQSSAVEFRARFKTCQLSLTLQAPTRQLRAPTGRLRFAVVTPVASEAVLKQALNGNLGRLSASDDDLERG